MKNRFKEKGFALLMIPHSSSEFTIFEVIAVQSFPNVNKL